MTTPAVPALPAPAATEPASVPAGLFTEASATTGGFGLLRAVRIGTRPDADRIVFEFVDAVPGYVIRYVNLPVQVESGEDVPLAGAAGLMISLTGSSAYRDLFDPEPAFDVPDRIPATTTQVTELVKLGDFEALLVWAAGVRERTGFRVLTLDAPPRLVIDVARR